MSTAIQRSNRRIQRGSSNLELFYWIVCISFVALWLDYEYSEAPATDVIAVAAAAEKSSVADEAFKHALAEDPTPSRAALRSISARINEDVLLQVAREKTGDQSLTKPTWPARTSASERRFEKLWNTSLDDWTDDDVRFILRHKGHYVLGVSAVLALLIVGVSLILTKLRVGVVAAVVLVGSSIAPTEASAAKLMDIRDGDTVIAVVSARDQTRIRVEQGRIVDVIGEIYDAKNNPGGRLTLVKDEAAGEVYVKFVPQGNLPSLVSAGQSADGGSPSSAAGAATSASFGGPLKLDVKTDRGTVGLLLQPAGVVGDTLVLQISGGQLKGTDDRASGKSSPHIRSIKALTLAMAAPEYATDVPMRRIAGEGEEVALWNEARFVLKARFDAGTAVGESYQLTNISNARMVIDERELYRPGVLAISVRQLTLQPGESTPVWILRSAPSR